MSALLICVFAFVACYWAGRRSLGQGLVVLLVFGYFYGILRANLLTVFSHFIFDAAMLGLYLARLGRKLEPDEKRAPHALKFWVVALVLWPALLVMLPFQPLLVSLVGLRGNIFFVPMVLLGSRLKDRDITQLSLGLAVLDMVAVAFAGAEYFMGLQRFYPLSPVTMIIYSSADVGGGFYRIPAIFANAHAFGGTMVATLPYLIGLWNRAEKRLHRLLALTAMPLALLGVLLSATRLNFILGCAMVLFVILTAKINTKRRILFLAVIGAIALAAMTNVRFQRFKSLGDTEMVSDRIAGSINRDFWEILAGYPMGNGLGGGGTSIPYFLAGDVRNPIGMENEYARILAEQGIIGLLIWAGFIIWFLQHVRTAFAKGTWTNARRLVWGSAAIGLGTAFIGTGLLTAMPETLFLVLGIGWTMTPPGRSAAPFRSELLLERRQRAFAPLVR